jgi:hypothetical protein
MSDGGGLTSEDAERYGAPEDPSKFERLKKWFLDFEPIERFLVILAAFAAVHFLIGLGFLWYYVLGTDMDANDPLIGKFMLMFSVTFAAGIIAFFSKMFSDF